MQVSHSSLPYLRLMSMSSRFASVCHQGRRVQGARALLKLRVFRASSSSEEILSCLRAPCDLLSRNMARLDSRLISGYGPKTAGAAGVGSAGSSKRQGPGRAFFTCGATSHPFRTCFDRRFPVCNKAQLDDSFQACSRPVWLLSIGGHLECPDTQLDPCLHWPFKSSCSCRGPREH